MNRRWQRYVFVALAGFILLALAYKFRLRTLQTITIAPAGLQIPRGARKRLIVIAHYRDGSVEESPANILWDSLAPGVAQISSEGMLVGQSIGSSTVEAKLNEATATVQVSVVPAVPIALAIFPANENISVG